jgi:23S rRNA pseudouridine1911/1915/1917 synthase
MESGEIGTVVHATAKMKLDPNARFSVTMMLSEDDDALTAGTIFTLNSVRHDPDDRSRSYSRVSCLLESGRQHQIRLHLKGLGAAIVGDKLYGPDETCFGRGADGELTEEDLLLLEHPRHALHATRLRLRHPITGAALTIEAPLPEDLEDFWAGLVPG